MYKIKSVIIYKIIKRYPDFLVFFLSLFIKSLLFGLSLFVALFDWIGLISLIASFIFLFSSVNNSSSFYIN